MEVCHDGFKYEIIGDDAVLKGFDEDNLPNLDKRQSIPSTVNGKTVMGVARRAFYRSGLRFITLPETIAHIGEYAFAGSKLEEISFLNVFGVAPTKVLKLGENAFENCIALKLFNTNRALTVAYKTFLGCGQLNSDNNFLRIAVLQADSFINCFNMKSIAIDDKGLLKQNCFRGSCIKEITVMDDVRFEDGVINELIDYDVLVKVMMDSPVISLAYLGVKVVEEYPF